MKAAAFFLGYAGRHQPPYHDALARVKVLLARMLTRLTFMEATLKRIGHFRNAPGITFEFLTGRMAERK